MQVCFRWAGVAVPFVRARTTLSLTGESCPFVIPAIPRGRVSAVMERHGGHPMGEHDVSQWGRAAGQELARDIPAILHGRSLNRTTQ